MDRARRTTSRAPSTGSSRVDSVSPGGPELKAAAEIAVMERAGRIVWEILQALREAAVPGATTL